MDGGASLAKRFPTRGFPTRRNSSFLRNPEAPKLIVGVLDDEGLKRAWKNLARQLHPDTLTHLLGRKPTRKELAEATAAFLEAKQAHLTKDWKKLNEMLRQWFPELRNAPDPLQEPPPEVKKPVPPKVKPKAPPPPRGATIHYASTAEDLGKAQALARSLSRRIPTATEPQQNDIEQEIMALWLASGAPFDPNLFRDYFNKAREKIIPSKGKKYRGPVVDVETHEKSAESATKARAAAEEEAEALAREAADSIQHFMENAVNVAQKALMEGSQVDKVKGTIVGLHLGKQMLPEQPAFFTRRVRMPEKWRTRKEGRDVKPRVDIWAYHTKGADRAGCPTCKAISRFLHVRELTPEAVSQLIDAFMFDVEHVVAGAREESLREEEPLK